MDLKPIKSYTDPAYPTGDTMSTNPELLRRIPARWRRNALVLAAIGAVGTLAYAAAQQGDQPNSRVAPVFQLQKPVTLPPGVAGGMRAPARFLTEDEARELIINELKAENITLKPDVQTVKDVPIARPDAEGKPQTEKIAVALDATDETKHIAFEYVSQADYQELMKQKDAAWMDHIQMQETAQLLQKGLTEVKPEGTYGVFYDPAVWDNKAAKEELRKQVKDFIAWLKAEKVI